MNKQVRFTTALALGAAVLSIPALAIGQVIVAIDGDEVSLAAKGIAAIVLVQATCSEASVAPPNRASVFVQLSQHGGKVNRNGFGSVGGFSCDNTPQTLEVLVTTDRGSFKQGSAAARAFLQSCSPDPNIPCDSAEVGKEVQLVR